MLPSLGKYNLCLSRCPSWHYCHAFTTATWTMQWALGHLSFFMESRCTYCELYSVEWRVFISSVFGRCSTV